MAIVEIRDQVIWASHIHGDPALVSSIRNMEADELAMVELDGVKGPCVKMKNGADGRPTHGLRPVGKAQAHWAKLYATRRGETVEFAVKAS
jgi:hypothetical protein